MSERIRALDWSLTPLGPIASWSPALRMMVRLLLVNRFPMLLWWGPRYISIYNDAYRPVLGTKHPRALGQPVDECWSEIWPVLQPLIDTPFLGGPATWNDDLSLEIHRHGFFEEAHFTVAYSPVPDDTVPGGIGGVLATVHEITEQVIGERRIELLRELGSSPASARSAVEACQLAADVLSRYPKDVPFALVYLVDAQRERAQLAASVGIAAEGPASPLEIELERAEAAKSWPLARAASHGRLEVVDDLVARFGSPVAAGPWSVPPTRAVVAPLRSGLATELAGLLVAGISSHLALDDSYRSFIELAANQVAAAIASAQAYEHERTRAEALAELDRAKTAFFSNVSHEFRTPLTLMLGPLEDALSDSSELLPEDRTRLELAHRNALRLLKLVNTLLDFARIESGRIQASYEPTDLAALTAEITSVFRSAIERAGLRLEIDCDAPGHDAWVDREMWEKIVLNLLSNAFKFTFEGAIAVALRHVGGCAELEVRDTGTGIPQAEMPHLFERFHRVKGARGRSFEGSGIGLALVHELVKLHGGAVQVSSELGRGSAFRVSIPLGSAHLPPDRLSRSRSRARAGSQSQAYVDEVLGWLPDRERGPRASPGTRPLEDLRARAGPGRARVLLADDNADLRDYVQRLLERDYEVEAVGDGRAALEAARARRPDLVLTDVMMPALDGFGLLRELRRDENLRGLPVIMLSARAGEEARVEGLEAGADDYLVKPFSARELLARVSARLELARMRAELDRERGAFSDLLRQSPVPIAVLRGPDLVFEMANLAYHAVMRGRDVLGKPLLEAFPELRGQSIERLLHDVMKNATPRIGHEVKVRFERPSSGRLEDTYWTFICAPLLGSGGRVDGVIAICNELTEQVVARRKIEALSGELSSQHVERRHAESALRDSEARMRLAMEGARMFSWEVDVATGDSQVSGNMDRVLGFSSEGRPRDFLAAIGRLVPPEDGAILAAAVERTARGEGDFRVEYRVRHPRTGEMLWLESVGALVPAADGIAARVVGIAHDITERKRAEQRLRDADQRKDEFLAMLAHELRNPLAAIRSAVAVLEQVEQPSGVPQRARQIIERQTRQLTRLVDDLLDVSRITRGHIEVVRERVDMAEIAERAVEMVRPQIDARGHQLAIALPDAPLHVVGDPTRLVQVVVNLLDNAAKYTPHPGRIELELRAEGASALVRVRDDGIGIPQEQLPRIFELFAQANPTLERSQGGLGIGLTVVRSLVELHGGSVQASSPGSHRGSEFVVRLPLCASGVERAPTAEPDPRRVPSALRVLIVEDHADTAEVLGMMLQLAGHTVRAARDGAAALEIARAFRPQLVLCDIGLPGMDGYQVAAALRAHPGFASTRLVALSGYGMEEDRRRSAEAGFDLHLIKPIEPAALTALLDSVRR
jgi:PAS domain S-box-containing protein